MKGDASLQPFRQLPRWGGILLVVGSLLLLFVALALLPLPIPPYLDFQVLYQTNMALLRGISVYDHAGQVNLIAQFAAVAPEQVHSLPFPYPPWYALSSLWLALLPIQVAARVWFGINLVLLCASVWLLTDRWQPLFRLIGLGLAIFFPPVLGSLMVGQYGFPVLLGAALMIYACQHERAGWVAVAAALLTLKPHLGGPVILAVLIYLIRRRDPFATRALFYSLGAGIILFAAGFLADRAWPSNYMHSLLAYRQDAGVTTCEICASLPAILANRISGAAGLKLALLLGSFIFVALAALLLARAREIVNEPFGLIAAVTLVLLLASPYLLNYDFLLLLAPFVWLAGREHKHMVRALLAGIYALPFLAIGLWGRQGNIVFSLCALLLLGMLYYRGSRPLDVSIAAAYND